MRKVISFLLAILSFGGFLLSGSAHAQSTPLVIAGGGTQPDSVVSMVLNPEHEPILLLHGSQTDTFTFAIERWNTDATLQWYTPLTKNAFPEVPNNVTWNYTKSKLLAIGYANADQNIWGAVINGSTGAIMNTTTAWSDFTDPQLGLSARAVHRSPDGYYIFTGLDDSISVYEIDEDAAFVNVTGNLLPAPGGDPELLITDIASFDIISLVTGAYGTADQPYVALYWNEILDGLFDIFTPGFVPAAATLDISWKGIVCGNAIDSSAIGIAILDTTGGLHISVDSIFDAPGYNLLVTDALATPDDELWVLTKHFTAVDTFHLLSKYDLDLNLLSEILVLDRAGNIHLSELVGSPIAPNYFAVAGTIKIPDPLSQQYLFMSTTDIGLPAQCIYNCVWPGDADNNGLVDMTDIFPVGAGFGSTGAARDSVSNMWYGFLSDEWLNMLGSENAKYGNTDGNTAINRDDTTAISQNYSRGHLLLTYRESEGSEVPIWLNTAGIFLHPGLNEIPIMLGTADVQAELIYGVSFNIGYSGLSEIIDTSSLKIIFDDSFLGTTDDLIQLNHLYYPYDNTIDAGVVGIDHINKSGYGQIGRMTFVVEDNIAGIMATSDDSSVYFFISDADAVTAELDPVGVYGNVFPAMVEVGIHELHPEQLNIFPNPLTGDKLYLPDLPPAAARYHYAIINTQGQTMLNGTIEEEIIYNTRLQQLAQGYYTIRITGSDGVYFASLIVQ